MISKSEMKRLACVNPTAMIAEMRAMEPPDLAPAAEYLGTFAPDSLEVVAYLTELSTHECSYVRERVVYGLARQTDLSEAVDALSNIHANDENDIVREIAYEALELFYDE